jgi:hypothetical protein
MKTIYRVYNSADIDAMVDFWNENADWDVINRKEWERRFYSTPFGPSSVILALEQESGEIVGQFIFIPSTVVVNGQEVKSCRPFAPVVKKSIRSELGMLTLVEYILKMYNYATEYFVQQGVYVIHMLPDPRWSRAFQFIPGVQVKNFPLWSLKLQNKIEPKLPLGYAVEEIKPDDDRIDELWSKASTLYGCSISRTSRTLPWKLSHGEYRLIGITYNSRLIGIAASIYKPKDKQWLICDMLVEDGEQALDITIQAICTKASAFKNSLSEVAQENLQKVAILATPMIEKAIRNLGFEKDTYKFSLVVHVLGSALAKKELNPENWYVSAND